jgi:pimeloyl-ACP methyl ester carboxylesterase
MPEEVKKSITTLNFFKTPEFDYQFMRALGLHYQGGASIGECLATASRINDGDVISWVEEWEKTARQVEMQGDDFLKRNQNTSASESYLRASMYYRSAEFYGFFSEPGKKENWMKSKECFQKAVKLFKIPPKVVEIPFEDMKLPGYLFTIDNRKRPTLLVMSGFDGTAEELYFYIGAGAIERGYNVFLFEGPGQVGPIHLYPDKPFRLDYEKPIKAVVDFVLTKEEVDPDKLVLIGFSIGGYYVARGIIHENRIKACVADSPIINVGNYYQGMGRMEELLEIKEDDYPYVFEKYPMVRWIIETLTRRYGVKDFPQLLEKIQEFNIEDDLNKIDCVTLSLVGEGEGDESILQTKKFFEGVSGPRAMHIFTVDEGADSHCQISNLALMNAVVFDWLDDILI